MHFFLSFFLFFIIVWPKVNLFNIPNSSVGVRSEDILIALLGIFFLLDAFLKKKYQGILQDDVAHFCLLFLGWSLFTTLLGIFFFKTVRHFYLGILHWGRYLEFALVFFAARSITWKEELIKKIFAVLAAATTCMVLYAFLQVLGWVPYFSTLQSLKTADEVTFPGTGVVMATFGGHYDFGIFLVFILCFALIFLFVFRNLEEFKHRLYVCYGKKLLYIGAGSFFLLVLCSVVCLVLTHSRSAYAAFLFVLLFLGLRYYKVLSAGAAAVLSVLGVAFLTGRLSRFVKMVDIGSFTLPVDLSILLRLGKWQNMFAAMSLISFLLGKGLSSQGLAMDGYYVRILGELGIFGLILFLYMLFYILRFCRKNEKEYKQSFWQRTFVEGLFWGTIALMIQALFIDTFISSKVMFVFWLLVGILFSCENKMELRDSQKRIINPNT